MASLLNNIVIKFNHQVEGSMDKEGPLQGNPLSLDREVSLVVSSMAKVGTDRVGMVNMDSINVLHQIMMIAIAIAVMIVSAMIVVNVVVIAKDAAIVSALSAGVIALKP